MKTKIKILIPIILCLSLSFSVYAQSFDDLEPINNRENSVSVFEDVESDNVIPQTSTKTTKDDVINTLLFTLGLKIPEEAKTNSIYDGFISWLGSRNLYAANQLDNLTNNYLTTQPYGIGQVFNITRELWETLREETENGVNLEISDPESIPDVQNTISWIETTTSKTVSPGLAQNISDILARDGFIEVYLYQFSQWGTPKYMLTLNCRMSIADGVLHSLSDTNKCNYTVFTSTSTSINATNETSDGILPMNGMSNIVYISSNKDGSIRHIDYDKFDDRTNLSSDSDYNVISKSDNLDAPIWNSSGDAPTHTHLESNDIQMNIVESDELADITEKIENDESDLTDEMVQNVGVAPYDKSTGYALNGLELAAIGAAMMNVVAQDLGQSIFEEAWNTVETFSFSLPSQSFVNVALWLSQQMETILYLTDYNQVFTMTCILLVACSLVGLTRLWKSSPHDTPDKAYKQPSRSNRKEK